MPRIKPTITKQDIICAETIAPPNALIVFGASGDLASTKLLPSIFQIYKRGLIFDCFYLLGCGRTDYSDETFRQFVAESILNSDSDISQAQIEPFIEKLYYCRGDYSDPDYYRDISQRLDQLDAKHCVDRARIFYLSVPPFLYTTIVDQLGRAQLSCPKGMPAKYVKLVIEKPFGKDSQTAAELNDEISKCFTESQVYRIDHYLGKETVQNILIFRFANAIFEPVWNRNYIDSVQITIAENLGIEHRASYYDKAGALRDMFQNHMLQMLSMVAMEPPTSFDADRIRDEKVKLLRSIRHFDLEAEPPQIIAGQYGPGMINGNAVPGYKEASGVSEDSNTETFVAAKLLIDNWRWQGVPFYLRTGKRLAAKDTEIAITFKEVPHSMFRSAGLDELPANILVMRIQPKEGISLSLQAKRPGSKICMSILDMSFSYSEVFAVKMPEAYQRLLLDCMVGDQTLFARYDGLEVAWRLITPVLEKWQKDASPPPIYPAGSDSFPASDQIIQADGRYWRKIAEG